MPGWIPSVESLRLPFHLMNCSCEDSSKVYWPLQCQIQGAIPYSKVAPSRCTVRCNLVPIPEAVCCATPKRDNNGLHG